MVIPFPGKPLAQEPTVEHVVIMRVGAHIAAIVRQHSMGDFIGAFSEYARLVTQSLARCGRWLTRWSVQTGVEARFFN